MYTINLYSKTGARLCLEGWETIQKAEEYIAEQMKFDNYESSDIRDENGNRIDWPFNQE